VLALGNEAAGLSKEILGMADYRVRVPTTPEKAESLNVAACGAILMYLSSGK
jgi:tRNA G18 (ribose-2'-O)-methylase SpoU